TLGDVFGNEVKTLMLELSIPVLRQAGEQQIATLRFEYDKITGNHTEHHIEEMPVMIKVSADAQIERHANITVEERVFLLKAAQAREEAVKAADNGSYTEAAQKLRSVAQSIGELSHVTPRLEEEQNALLKQAIQMEAGENRYTEYNRKTMATQAFYTRKDRHDDTVMLRLRENQRSSRTEQMSFNQSDIIPPPLQTSALQKASPEERATDVEPQPGVMPKYVEYKGRYYPLTDKLMRLGRSVNNEIVIAERGVSRFHAQITRDGNKLVLTDLQSTNGTIVREQALKKPYFLSVGDAVYISEEKLMFHLTIPPNQSTLEQPNADPEEHPTMPERPEHAEYTGRDNTKTE
ncbi:MAG: FHA domain-containing protein, partial [Aggregatilineales bacterium]